MIRRIAVVVAVLLTVTVTDLPVAEGQEGLISLSEQEEAADAVKNEIAVADAPLAPDEIDAFEALGPAPWLALGPERSDEVIEAWIEVADQLPENSRAATSPGGGQPVIDEQESVAAPGTNDTPATGERIFSFGTNPGLDRAVTITGNLSGADVRPPFDFDCTSVEDDGAIPLANATPAAEIQVALCGGEIGDGPFGDSSGDVDVFSFGEVGVDTLLVVDTAHVLGSLDPVETVIGIYDASGNLLVSGLDSGDPNLPEFIEFVATEPGEYFGFVAAAGDLPSDPFDAASGTGAGETGTYEVFILALPAGPPVEACLSVEDDGAIPVANDASAGFGDDLLFVTECFGLLGDAQPDTGDIDVFTTRELVAGKQLVVDLFDINVGPGGPGESFLISVYDDAGALVGSGQDPNTDPSIPEFFQVEVPADGVYHVAISGGEIGDPFDTTSGTDTTNVGEYGVALVDTTQEVLDDLTGEPAWRLDDAAADSTVAPTALARTAIEAATTEAQAEAAAIPDDAVDFFKVRLRKGDAISGGFDNARLTGILDPNGELRMGSDQNVTFIYPVESFLRHDRRTGFDHVATTNGVHTVFVAEGVGAYEGELRVVRSGLADDDTQGVQRIYVDFDGASVSPSIFDPFVVGEPAPEVPLTPMADFLPAWGLDPTDEDALIDGVIDVMIENLDTDLRIRDGRNGNRDLTRIGGSFDIEILNSRDHPDVWGGDNVSRIIIGGTIDELTIPTIGIAQSIDPGNTDTTETGVVLLDLLSQPDGDPISLNSYELANGASKVDLVANGVGHIAAHEVGHYIGNWHTETFNIQPSLMDAGGEFSSVFGVGEDGVLGTADDVDADFVEDVFNPVEGFEGTEDTSGRSTFALSTGSNRGPAVEQAFIGDSVTTPDGLGVPGVTVQLYETGEYNWVGTLVDTTETNYQGFYQAVAHRAGCYRIKFSAPEGFVFENGRNIRNLSTCVVGGQTRLGFDVTVLPAG